MLGEGCEAAGNGAYGFREKKGSLLALAEGCRGEGNAKGQHRGC